MKKSARPEGGNGKTTEKPLSLITEASAIAQIALSLARVERNEAKSLLADATERIPEAHELFIRSFEMARCPPQKNKVVQLKASYSYDELCAGDGTVIEISGFSWNAYAKEGDGFIEHLRHYALSSLEAELDKVRGSLTNCLRSLGPALPQFDTLDPRFAVDPRLYEIPDILKKVGTTESLIRRQDMDDLLNLVDQAISNGEERTSEWADQKLKEWSQKIAEKLAKDWHMQSKGSGLSSVFVTKLAGHRSKRQLNKRPPPKDISNVSQVP